MLYGFKTCRVFACGCLEDLAIVRQKENFKTETYEKKIEVLLYEDETTEDYTAKKEINICEE